MLPEPASPSATRTSVPVSSSPTATTDSMEPVASAPLGTTKPGFARDVLVTHGTEVGRTRRPWTTTLPTMASGASVGRLRQNRSVLTFSHDVGGPDTVTSSVFIAHDTTPVYAPPGVAGAAPVHRRGAAFGPGRLMLTPWPVEGSIMSTRARCIHRVGSVTSISMTSEGKHWQPASK